MNSSNCTSTNIDWNKRRRSFQKRRLVFLTFLRDSYERKLAAIQASIKTLESQMASNEDTIHSD